MTRTGAGTGTGPGTSTGAGQGTTAAAARAGRRGGVRRARTGRWIALGGALAAALVATGVAVAATNGGDSTAAGPSADKGFAACVAAGKAYCPAPGQAQGPAPHAQQAAPAAMTESEAVGAALKLAAPAADGKSAALAPAHTDRQMTLADYEKATYGGKHVNTSFSPQAHVWVIDVAAAPNPASVNAPSGVTPPTYTHYTVVIDVATHQWVEEDYGK